jgi:hypothetical protein
MWRSVAFFILSTILFSASLLSQSAETAIRPYDSVRGVVEQTVREYKDSLEREKLLQNIRQRGKPLDVFLAERREEEKKEERRRWVRLGAGAIFLFALFVAIARRSKSRRKP